MRAQHEAQPAAAAIHHLLSGERKSVQQATCFCSAARAVMPNRRQPGRSRPISTTRRSRWKRCSYPIWKTPVTGWRTVQGLNSAASVRRSDMEDREIRAALDRHWAASDASDFEAEHQIYREDAVLEYPQSGERIRGRLKIQSSRAAQPNRKRFTVRRIIGAGDLWVTEYVLSYDGLPSFTVSIMEFLDGKVARETQYFGDPFEPGPSRAQWVERTP